MNKEFHDYAVERINSMSTEELGQGLRDAGILSNNLNQGASIEAAPCPFCGGEASRDAYDRGIDIGCKACGYTRHFPGLLQPIRNDKPIAQYRNGAGGITEIPPSEATEFYHSDANERAIEAWNRRTPAAQVGAGELPSVKTWQDRYFLDGTGPGDQDMMMRCMEDEIADLRAQLAAPASAQPAQQASDAELSAIVELARATTDAHCDSLPNEPTKEYSNAYFFRTLIRAAEAGAQPDQWVSAAVPKRRDIFGICDAYESGIGHGLQRDGHKSGAMFGNPEHGMAYEIGYEEGESRASPAAQPAKDEQDAPKCWCHTCNEDRTVDGWPYSMTTMILCPTCGNKRCPRATNHALACTNSNEPGQPGSVYGDSANNSADEQKGDA